MNTVATFGKDTSRPPHQIRGTVRFFQAAPGAKTLVAFDLAGFGPGAVHGCHINAFVCDLAEIPAGGHYSPENSGQCHGSFAWGFRGRHTGDLCNNIVADARGQVRHHYWDDLVSLVGPDSVVGRLVVIRQWPDDCRSVDCKSVDLSGKMPFKRARAVASNFDGNAGSAIAAATIGLCGPFFFEK